MTCSEASVLVYKDTQERSEDWFYNMIIEWERAEERKKHEAYKNRPGNMEVVR